MAQVSNQEILEALKGVNDPDRNADIVNLGMVSGLAVKDGNVAFAIEVDSNFVFWQNGGSITIGTLATP